MQQIHFEILLLSSYKLESRFKIDQQKLFSLAHACKFTCIPFFTEWHNSNNGLGMDWFHCCCLSVVRTNWLNQDWTRFQTMVCTYVNRIRCWNAFKNLSCESKRRGQENNLGSLLLMFTTTLKLQCIVLEWMCYYEIRHFPMNFLQKARFLLQFCKKLEELKKICYRIFIF